MSRLDLLAAKVADAEPSLTELDEMLEKIGEFMDSAEECISALENLMDKGGRAMLNDEGDEIWNLNGEDVLDANDAGIQADYDIEEAESYLETIRGEIGDSSIALTRFRRAVDKFVVHANFVAEQVRKRIDEIDQDAERRWSELKELQNRRKATRPK